MNGAAARTLGPADPGAAVDFAAIVDALPECVLLLGPEDEIRFANAAAEQLFDAGRSWLTGQPLRELLPPDSPLFGLIAQARAGPTVMSEHGVVLSTPRIGDRFVTIQVAPLPEQPGHAVVTFREQSVARKIDGQLTHRSAARSVSAMAAMLAHEVKNPLSGIRGAAQLLEEGLGGADRQLTRLICEEADRICTLVDDMGVFSDTRPLARVPVNIHEALDRVRQLAQASFGKDVVISEFYDPSLPPVLGHRDQLVQVFLNLVKNACEAVPARGGHVRLATAYRHGVRLAVPGSDSRVALPLMVSVTDNGEGIPADLRPHLFDPFVTTRANGKGLGLALVAKIVNDHGGVVELESKPRRTVFRVMLPAAQEADHE